MKPTKSFLNGQLNFEDSVRKRNAIGNHLRHKVDEILYDKISLRVWDDVGGRIMDKVQNEIRKLNETNKFRKF